ncbi:MAG: late control protein [Deltaproteobacteria bacterium]|jgi:phage protein D|nr:late control protein [Deltaproteobacteria bacterium]
MRRARLEVNYQGANISAEVSRDMLSFTFSEKSDRQADEISLTLADRDALWQGEWAVNHGDVVRPILYFENWFTPGDRFKLDCGAFEVDEDELACGSGGDVVTIKALPAAVSAALSAERKTRPWENVSFERVAADIAAAASLTPVYEAPEILFKRVEQRQESDLAFLQRLASEQGCRLRVALDNLVIYQGKNADAAPPLLLRRADGGSLTARRGKCEVYKAAVLKYTDAASGKTMKYTATLDNAPDTAKTLNLNKKVEDAAQAQRVAFAELRNKNSQGRTAEFQGQAQPLARAGGTVKLQGWGAYDGLYSIAEASLTLRADGAAESRLSLVAALEY